MTESIADALPTLNPHSEWDAMWAKISADKLPFYRAVSNLIGIQTMTANGKTDTEQIIANGNLAGAFLRAYDGIKVTYEMTDSDAQEVIDRISRWFKAHGWLHLRTTIADAIADATETQKSAFKVHQIINAKIQGE